MLRVVRHEGVASLWSGLQPALIMSVPGTVLYFSLYEGVRDAIAHRCPEKAKDWAPMVAGGGSRMFTATVVSPIELMRTRMQAERALLEEGMIGGAAALVRREGYGALWKGLSATLWRDVPFSCLCAFFNTPFVRICSSRGAAFSLTSAVPVSMPAGPSRKSVTKPSFSHPLCMLADWFGYEALKRKARTSGLIGHSSPSQEIDPTVSFLCGASSGAVAAFLTTPFDVLKTRRQVARMTAENVGGSARAGAAAGLGGAPADAGGLVITRGGGTGTGTTGRRAAASSSQLSTPRLVLHVARTEGMGALFAGWVPRLVKVAPSCAVMIASYELGKAFFRRRRSVEAS